MREIKFRAWDRILKKMTYEVSMKLREDEYINILDMFAILNQRYDFMQYTGLKDKNGKEIYEGDIILFDENKAVVFYGNGKFRVKYKMCAGGLRYQNLSDVLYYNTTQVIGNFYENKELIINENKWIRKIH